MAEEMSTITVVPLLLFSLIPSCLPLQLLGAGEGAGSCPAPPYRAAKVHHLTGCPAHLACCNEFGFCKSQADWLSGQFRACNGVSNGLPLPDQVIRLEAIYTAISNGLIPGIASTEDPTGKILDVEDTQTEVATAIVAGQGGGAGDGGAGGFRGAGGGGGRGGDGGANGGDAGNGGLGGNGGAGAAGGDGGDGGDSGYFIPSHLNIVDTTGSYLKPSLVSSIGGRGGSGGNGGQGGNGIRNGKGANGGSGGNGGQGNIGGNGGRGGNGGKGGFNAAGGNGGNGGSGGLGFGLSNILVKAAAVVKAEPAVKAVTSKMGGKADSYRRKEKKQNLLPVTDFLV